MDSFRTHLDAYLTLFTKLRQLRFYYIATRDTNFERAKKLFHETFQRLWNPDSPFGLLQYFRTRRLWDEKQLRQAEQRRHRVLEPWHKSDSAILESKSCTRNGVRESHGERSSGPNPASIARPSQARLSASR